MGLISWRSRQNRARDQTLINRADVVGVGASSLPAGRRTRLRLLGTSHVQPTHGLTPAPRPDTRRPPTSTPRSTPCAPGTGKIRASPLQNRVAPDGLIIAAPARGTMMGNRGGVLHSPDQRASRAALGVAAMDLLSARLQGAATQSHDARRVHRAVFSRRSKPRWPPGTDRASNAAAKTLCASPSCGRWRVGSTRAHAPPRSTACCTLNVSTRREARDALAPGWPIFRSGR